MAPFGFPGPATVAGVIGCASASACACICPLGLLGLLGLLCLLGTPRSLLLRRRRGGWSQARLGAHPGVQPPRSAAYKVPAAGVTVAVAAVRAGSFWGVVDFRAGGRFYRALFGAGKRSLNQRHLQ